MKAKLFMFYHIKKVKTQRIANIRLP
jgi:hypothetical protein